MNFTTSTATKTAQTRMVHFSPTMLPETQLSKSVIQQCAQTLKHGSKSFSMAAWLLPKDVRLQATVFYAFCREADDAIDEGSNPYRELERLRRRVAAIYAGSPLSSEDAILGYVLQFAEVPKRVLDALLEGFEWDLASRRYDTYQQLQAYCVRVAGTVGVAMCHFMGVRDTITLARACDLGVAMQLTNIARDIHEDWQRGRLYVPMRALDPYGGDPKVLVDPSNTARSEVAMQLLSLSDRLYTKADLGIDRLPENCRLAIRAAARIYAGIGDVIRSEGLELGNRRAYLGRHRKVWLLLQAFAQSFVSRRTLSSEELRKLNDSPIPEANILFS